MEEIKNKKKVLKIIFEVGAILLCIFFFTIPLVRYTQNSKLNASGWEIAAGEGKLFSEIENDDNLLDTQDLNDSGEEIATGESELFNEIENDDNLLDTQDLNDSGEEIATGEGEDEVEDESRNTGYPLVFLLIIIPVVFLIASFVSNSFAMLRNISIAGLLVKIGFLIYANSLLNSDKYKEVFELTVFNWIVLGLYIGLCAIAFYFSIKLKEDESEKIIDNKTVLISDAKTLIKNNIKNYSMFIILMLIMAIFGPMCGWTNFKGRNITYIFFQFSYVFILATGMVQCIIICGIDLSVGSLIAFIGALSVYLYNTGVGMFVTIIASLAMGFAVGAFQGWFIAYPKIPPFIATLAGMLLFRGLTYIVTNVSPVSPQGDAYSYLSTGTVDEDLLHMEDPNRYYPITFILALIIIVILWVMEFKNKNTKITHGDPVPPKVFTFGKLALITVLLLVLAERFASYRGLPIVVIVLLITVGIFHFIMKNTVLGRYIYAVGGNERSAKLSGINTEFVTFIVYCFMGTLAGLAAVIYTGYMNSALPKAGEMFEMDAIAACYIGGVSATGGIGTVVGVVVGGLIMCAINNGMTLMNLGSHYQYVVKALVVLTAVFYDVYSRRKAGLG